MPVDPSRGGATAPPSSAGPPAGPAATVEVPLPQLRLARASARERIELKVEYAEVRLGDRTGFVRTYNGRLVGPTLRVRPGETLYMDIANALPDDPSDPAGAGHSHHAGHAAAGAPQDINIPHGFNITNFHTHGLHVRPDYPSRCKGKEKTCDAVADNVLIDILPGKSQRYEIEVPEDHPPGTHWYHAHRHGSVAMQLASGMAGMLIVEGGLDDVPEIKQAKEQLLAFQQLRFSDCGRKQVAAGQGPEKCSLGEAPNQTFYESCDAYFQRLVDARVLPSYPKGSSCVESFDFSFGARRLQEVLQPRFGYHTAINGQVMPLIEMRQGELQRWRALHAGILESIQLGLVPVAKEASQKRADALATAGGERVPLQVIAYDGIATGRMDTVDHMALQPGYRADLLVRIDAPGEYVLVDLATPAQRSLHGTAEEYAVLARVRVHPSSEPPMPLPSAAALAPLAPYKHVEDAEIKGYQYATFNFGTSGSRTTFLVNTKAYDPAAAPRTATLGRADEWVVNSKSVHHPFHIHVNPFELQEDYGDFKKGTWKDTLLVEQDKPFHARTRYEDFTGEFVLHCHILNHEDQGMMQAVRVIPPGAKDSSCPTLAGSGTGMCASPPPEDGQCAAPKRR